MQLTPRKLNALVLLGLGLLLTLSAEPLDQIAPGSYPLVSVACHLVTPLGVIFLALGAYRYWSREEP